MVFHRFFHVAGIALAYAITIASAKSSLSLMIFGSEYIETKEDFRIIVTLRNTGDETIKVLNDPQSVLSDMPADIFTISNEIGSSPAFTGIKAKYVPEVAIAMHDYTTLKPGQSVEIEHDLSLAYDFSFSGAGEYSIHPSNLFHIVDPSSPGDAIVLYADYAPHVASVSDFGVLDLGDQRFFNATAQYDNDEAEADDAMSPSFIGCSARQQNLIRAATNQAQTFVSRAYGFLRSNPRSNRRYNTWFGSFNYRRYNTVLQAFRTINGSRYSTYTYDCSSCHKKPSTFAYVYPDKFGTIYLCQAFWRAPIVGTDSKAGTIVHESSHFTKNGGTDDHAYGRTKCKDLARRSPDIAIHNADSYEYFTENNS